MIQGGILTQSFHRFNQPAAEDIGARRRRWAGDLTDYQLKI
jgi:hypothetical protein